VVVFISFHETTFGTIPLVRPIKTSINPVFFADFGFNSSAECQVKFKNTILEDNICIEIGNITTEYPEKAFERQFVHLGLYPAVKRQKK